MFDAKEKCEIVYSFAGKHPTTDQVEEVIADSRYRGVPENTVMRWAIDGLGQPAILFAWTGNTWSGGK